MVGLQTPRYGKRSMLSYCVLDFKISFTAPRQVIHNVGGTKFYDRCISLLQSGEHAGGNNDKHLSQAFVPSTL